MVKSDYFMGEWKRESLHAGSMVSRRSKSADLTCQKSWDDESLAAENADRGPPRCVQAHLMARLRHSPAAACAASLPIRSASIQPQPAGWFE